MRPICLVYRLHIQLGMEQRAYRGIVSQLKEPAWTKGAKSTKDLHVPGKDFLAACVTPTQRTPAEEKVTLMLFTWEGCRGSYAAGYARIDWKHDAAHERE
ncbi:hypothetical protein Baya_14538 [Bagarius yarrelli]|uniref:Uncharacterized protein n=1 Tax=Bagarius yarrelli TaxID=175774 RepID=A0A556V984_BAGYA|nr:hypothetical protein Baya_14538 [Bagarius yarrelli]